MKELKSLRKAGESTFLTLTKDLPASTSLALFAGNSGAMIAGHEGIVTEVDYKEVQGVNTPVVGPGGQRITIGGEEIELAKEGEKPQAVTITFSTGRTMTLGLLQQGQDKTTILFNGDAQPTPSTDLNLGNISKLIGKQFKCTKFWRDNSNPIVRNAGSTDPARKERSYAANCYEFVETPIVAAP